MTKKLFTIMLCGIASQVRQYVNRSNYAHIKCAILSVLENTEEIATYNLYIQASQVYAFLYCLCSLMSFYLTNYYKLL